jgi:hypothetical protein
VGNVYHNKKRAVNTFFNKNNDLEKNILQRDIFNFMETKNRVKPGFYKIGVNE